MTLPTSLFNKYLSRFEELINEGEEISRMMNKAQSLNYPAAYRSNNYTESKMVAKWKTNCISLLSLCLPKQSVHQDLIKKFLNMDNDSKYLVDVYTSELKAIKEDFEQGFLGDLMLQIEAEIAADYMGQAQQLLAEGTTSKYDHVPAAVLSGAVLEKALRTLCNKQTPPISTTNTKGLPLTLNPLIDELKKADVFNELKAKQLKAWADIRNKAAHGEFEQFSSSDVETMIKGIENFLADYMG